MKEHLEEPKQKSPSAPHPIYRLSAKGREKHEDDRLCLLEQLFDPASRRRRELVQPGWRCLEVGAGRGSMAAWLAERVGPDGRVVATDIDTTYLQRLKLPNLEIIRHDILKDSLEPLGPGSFDLVSSRLMLFWLPGRQEEALRRMMECLRPGGWLIDEDGDWGMVMPANPWHPHYAAFHAAWREGHFWSARGYDPAFGRTLPALFERCGLVNVRHEANTGAERGGSLWGRYWKQSLEAIRASEASDGSLTPERAREYEALVAPLDDPHFWFLNVLLHACWGQRPAS